MRPSSSRPPAILPSRRASFAALLLFAALIVAASCSSTDTGATAAPAPRPPAAGTPAPFDVGKVMRQVHFAYRPEGSGFGGGHRTYAVHASAEGVAFTPASAEVGLGEPVRFETTAIGRGPTLRAPAPFAARVVEDGHLAIARGEAVEHLRNDEDGVEQSFAFAARPEGRGDLAVRVRVSGEAYAGRTEGGHHFVDPLTGLGVRYGAATWVDARGARTALEVAWTGAELSIAVPEEVLEKAAYPAAIDPTVSAEFGMDNPVTVSALRFQITPSVVWGGTQWLVVWTDTRVSSTYPYMMAARVATDGTVLDPGGIYLGTGVSSGKPAAAFDGSNFLAVWQAYESSTGYNRIYGARISAAGAVLPGAPFAITASGVSSTTPAVASNGSEYLVVYERYISGTSDYDIYQTRVSLSGTPQNPSGTAIGSATNAQLAPAVLWNGANYLAVWQDRRSGTSYDIYGTRVSSTGVALDTGGIPISTAANDQLSPAIAFDGQNYLVAWSDARWGNADIYAARVDPPTGLVIDTSGIGVTPQTAGSQTTPSVAFDGTNYVLAWTDNRLGNPDVFTARLSPTAIPLDGTGLPFPPASAATAEQAPSVACNGASCFAVWQDQRGVAWDVYGARFSNQTVTDPQGILVTSAASEETYPAVASNGQDYLVVWQDLRVLTTDVYGARVSGAGVVLDTSGIAISTAASDQATPRVAWMAPSYLVVWEDKRNDAGDIYGARVATNGSVLDPNGFIVNAGTSEQRTPAVASDGTDYLVVWQNTSNFACAGARVSAAGAVLDAAGFAVTSSTCNNPAVAFGATRYLVVWSDGFAARAGRVTTSATLLDPLTGFSLPGVTRPQVAFDGQDFLTVFEKSQGVFGARVTGAGVVLDTAGLPISPSSTAPSDQPAVDCDGQTCFVAWRDYRSGAHYDIYGAFVDQAGAVLNTGGVAVSTNTSPNNHLLPAVARDTSGHALVVYQRFDAYPPLGTNRVHARLVTGFGQGAPCAQGTQCASGFCADGVCCNTACGGGVDTDCLACSAAKGASADGTCTPVTGTSCNDGNACTQNDVCQAGTCMGGSPVTCAASDQCHLAGTCNPATGCSNPSAPNGTPCNDGNACTQTDTCQSGACTGGNPVVCPAATPCTTVSACDPTTGTCAVANKPDGTACSDGDACTQTDTCQAGACVGSNPVTCTALDQCHVAGTCNPATGVCSNPSKANGTPCNDGNACTQTDTCQSGACTGGNPVVCPAATPCTTVSACDPTTGTCAVANKPDGTTCSDGDACTQGDACHAGICVAGAPVTCAAQDECHDAGTCNPANGTCSNPQKADGTPCSNGTCQSGTCMASMGTGGSTTSSSSSSASSGGGGTGGAATSSSSSSSSSGGTGGSTTTSASSGGGTGGSATSSSSSSASSSGSGGTGGSASSSSSSSSSSGSASSSSSSSSSTTSSSSTGSAGAGGGESSSSGQPGSSGGCGCRVTGEDDGPSGVPAAVALAALAFMRRRQRRAA
jgi:MYXO-CTERM domain-containing protein